MTEDDHAFSAIESAPEERFTGEMDLKTLEKIAILSVIRKNKGNISKSAQELGIIKTALYRRLEKYDLLKVLYFFAD